ncbi:hypothetical protein DQ04_00491200 [Trypanosoma grayi]|uniref:hypothetical protein n=1 Tax=Trypanosoma grayi TaxID=71804 RepID=UPI0004F43226|nr:hypothetical protein DQ04_00491200 [Trypanosoma grayi]KEG14400.1 hypothetical protein DQ04_00491200 [Trypanosoma grayi]
MIQTLGSWDEGIHAFLENARQSGPQPWDMSYEDGRRMTRDPRVLRQLQLEDEWKDTCMEGIWAGMRRIARPVENFKVSESRFYEYLSSIGISSEHLKCRLFEVFRSDTCAEVDCLRTCKAIHMGLTNECTSSNFLEHCYKCLPFSLSSGEVEIPAVMRELELQRRVKDQKTSVILRVQQLEGVLSFCEEAEETILSMENFMILFFDEAWCLWASSFVKQIFEAAAKYFRSPYGVFPTIPLRWTLTTEPLPYDRHTIYDANSLLLRNIELTGRENADGSQKKRRPRKGAVSKKRKRM